MSLPLQFLSKLFMETELFSGSCL